MNLQDSIQSGAIEQLTQANKQLEQQVLELKKDNARHLRLIDLDTKKLIEWGDKAGAWDDLETLVDINSENGPLTELWSHSSNERYFTAGTGNGHESGSSLAEAVSNALVHVKEKG